MLKEVKSIIEEVVEVEERQNNIHTVENLKTKNKAMEQKQNLKLYSKKAFQKCKET